MSSSPKYRVVLEPLSAFSGEFDSIKVYGALVSAIGELYGDVEEILGYIKEGKLRVSSPMPKSEEHYYVFKPMLPTAEKINYKDFKKFKRRIYIRENLAVDALQKGTYTPEHMSQILEDENLTIKSEDLPGVAIGRGMVENQIYYKRALYYPTQIWILVEMPESIKSKILSAFRYLGDVGISRKRTSGFGHFRINVQEYEERGEGNYRMLISKYILSPEELKSFPFERSKYNIKLISGYSREGVPIPMVRALTEGSVYPGEFDMPIGRVVTISDKYSIVGVPMVI